MAGPSCSHQDHTHGTQLGAKLRGALGLITGKVKNNGFRSHSMVPPNHPCFRWAFSINHPAIGIPMATPMTMETPKCLQFGMASDGLSALRCRHFGKWAPRRRCRTKLPFLKNN